MRLQELYAFSNMEFVGAFLGLLFFIPIDIATGANQYLEISVFLVIKSVF